MLSCKEITEQSSEYIDKNMSFYQRMQYKLHLAMCHNCRRFMDQFKITVNTVEKMEPEKLSDEAIEKQVRALIKPPKE